MTGHRIEPTLSRVLSPAGSVSGGASSTTSHALTRTVRLSCLAGEGEGALEAD